jgi:hypothetical protein
LGAIDRYYELSLQHSFLRYLLLGAYASYEIADYVGDPLIDQRLKEGLTADPLVSVYGRYEHTNFTSTNAASDFRRERGEGRREAQTLIASERCGRSDQLLDLGGEGVPYVGAVERVSDIGDEEADLRAAIETPPLIFQRVERLELE